MGNLRTRRDLPNSPGLSKEMDGHRASTGTKTPISHRVQVKEKSPLSPFFLVAIKPFLFFFFNAQYESCKLSCKVRYMGQNEDCNPGDNISDNSEKPMQRGKGERSVYM